jgi:hypothetical protein
MSAAGVASVHPITFTAVDASTNIIPKYIGVGMVGANVGSLKKNSSMYKMRCDWTKFNPQI